MINGIKFRKDQLLSEVQFETSRSSGKGGQHVNKTETRVTLVFDLNNSMAFTNVEKERLHVFLKNRLAHGILRMSCQETRSQLKNKEIIIERFLELLAEGLRVRKQRKPTKVPKSKIEERLKAKRFNKEKKSGRQKIRKDDY
ncbi:MAG: alternative ribosome rescue aminoacyl-tRNA hydrolase ArfB [Crocinitomicaceae bacterium]|nr:aminoacyl-tRNA hydrolase [Crocinitomicaceae bacterium]